jgi:DNA polymerase III subunit epsilon
MQLTGRDGLAAQPVPQKTQEAAMLREIVLDTETTGLDPKTGDRIVEIGCLELVNRFPSGREWHYYFNPDRDMPEGAFKVHGISAEFLKDKPRFKEFAKDFLGFIGDATLVIHNAPFDMNFLNHELTRLKLGPLSMDRVVDTLAMARRKHPGAQASLDALCKRYGVDTTVRNKHGALIDCKLLADVYIEMLGARQANLLLPGDRVPSHTEANGAAPAADANGGINPHSRTTARQRSKPLPSRLSQDDIAKHDAFVATLGPQAIWLKS